MGQKLKLKMDIIAEAQNGFKRYKYYISNISVGATENAILAAFKAKGKTTLNNCAIEPEILDLINFLNKIRWRY